MGTVVRNVWNLRVEFCAELGCRGFGWGLRVQDLGLG